MTKSGQTRIDRAGIVRRVLGRPGQHQSAGAHTLIPGWPSGSRDFARQDILAAANKNLRYVTKRYTMRRINQAVHKCRRRGLVDAATLELAGFNSKDGSR